MAKETYVEVNNVAKVSKKGYIGIEGIARKLLKGYIGDDNNVARLFFNSEGGGEIILPPSVGSASYSGSGLVYSSWSTSGNYLICKRFGDFLFISSNNYTGAATGGQRLQGLYVVNMKKGTVKQITTANHTYMHGIELKENRYLVSDGINNNNFYLYNGENETVTVPPLSMGGFNHKIDLGDKVIIRSQNSKVDLYLYDKNSETFTSLGLPLHDIKNTSQGIFAFCSYGTSESYSRVYKFNQATDTFEKVDFVESNGNVWSPTANYTQRMHVDTYGTVWICSIVESTTPVMFDGTYFTINWEGTSGAPNFGYQNPPIFKLNGEDCFITGTRIWAFKENKIQAILTTDWRTKYCSAVNFAVSKGDRTYIKHDVKNATNSNYGAKFFIWKNGVMEYSSMNSSTFQKEPNVAFEIKDKTFLSGGYRTFEVTGGDDGEYGLVTLGDYNISSVFEIDNEIYAMNSSTLYKYENGTFKSIVSRSGGNSLGVVQAGSFINVIGYYNAYNTGSESAINTYNLINGEVKTLSTKVRYRLGQTSYVSNDSKVVRDVFDNSINSYNFNINAVTDFLTRGGSATGWSNHNVLAYVSNTNLSFLYEIPGEWEYRTVKWDTGEDIYETQIVKGGYLEEMQLTKDGYEFKGWYKNGEKFDFTQPVNGNITLVAEWEKLTWEEVDYIESSGTQYIDTGFTHNQNTKLEIKASFNNIDQIEAIANSANANSPYNSFNLFKINNEYRTDYAESFISIPEVTFSINTPYIFLQDRNKSYVDGTLVATHPTATFTGSFPIRLLAKVDGTKQMSGKLYYCKIWDNETLVRDFVPIKLSNGKYALLDKVNNKIYNNKGTGDFTGGNIGEATTLNYIESTGTQFIDTGITPTSTTRVETNMAVASLNSSNYCSLAGSNDFKIMVSNLYFNFCVGTTYQQTSKSVSVGTKYKIVNNVNGACSVDGTTLFTGDPSTVASTSTLKIGAIIDGTNIWGSVRVYDFKIYDGTTLVRDFIPYRNENDVVCLYDKVENKAYYNAGTGNFIGG